MNNRFFSKCTVFNKYIKITKHVTHLHYQDRKESYTYISLTPPFSISTLQEN